MKNFSLALIFLLSFVCVSHIFSQKPSYQGFGGGEASGKISGVVIDASTNQPVEYAIVAIHKMKDSALVTGSTCTSNGAFSIENIAFGKFYAEVSFVGYKKQTFPNILVIPNNKEVNIGTIKLEPSVTNINEVVVTGNKSIEYKIDKKVVDVSSNLVAASGTVVDALQNTPSVQTDVEGNVTLRGSSNFTVLIDGKPSPIAGSDALQQIPASIVQSVEIITNPSAKYDAEGSAGIINVIMKKQKVSGINGIFNVTAGTRNKYSANFNLNYKVSKFNFTLGADFNDMKFYNTMYTSNTKKLIDTILSQTINGSGIFERIGGGIKGGIDYRINDNNSISVTGNYGSRKMERNFSTNNLDEYDALKYDSIMYNYYLGNNNSEGNHKYYYNLNLDYQLKLDSKGQQLSASAYFSQGPDDDISHLNQDTTYGNWKLDTSKKVLRQYSAQNSNESELRTKLDYTLPIGEKGKLEAGYQGRYFVNNADYTFNSYRMNSQGDRSSTISENDNLNFTENIQAGYASYSNSMFLFDYQIGLRAEYEHRFIHLKSSNAGKLDTLNLFPSVYLTRQLPLDLQLQVNYTRRINRPRDWSLDPLPRIMNPTTIRKGNPELLPEYANSYELNLQKKISDASFISVEAFFRQTIDKIQDSSSFNPKTKITTMTSFNINHDQSTGVEFMVNLSPVKWFTFNSSASLYDYRLYNDSAASKSNVTWNLRFNPSFRLMWGTSIQINYVYNAPTITAQGTRSGFYNSSIGIRQDILKHKGSLTLNIQNPFGITRMSNTTNTNNLISNGYFQRESKVVMLSLSYRFNNYKIQQNKRPQDEMNNGDNEFGGGM